MVISWAAGRDTNHAQQRGKLLALCGTRIVSGTPYDDNKPRCLACCAILDRVDART